jgi:DMSO/TMAO reductase YedYZ molybdopterin-dependent catalytic subunit
MARAAVNYALLVSLLLLALTGGAELFGNSGTAAWLYWAHRGAAVALIPLLVWKAPIAWRSLRRRGLGGSTWPGLGLAVAVVALALTGGAWLAGFGHELELAGNSLLALHLYAFFLLAIPLGAHLIARPDRPRPRLFRPRRTMLRLGIVAGAGLASTTAFALASPWLARFPAQRRFSGSFRAGDGSGNDFPVTAFMADDPAPVDISSWRLQVTGQVENPLTVTYQELRQNAGLTATVDCTGGWYAERRWSGLSLGDVLAMAGLRADAVAVTVRSITGHWTALPLDEARQALLATHVGGELLAHGHGFPLRLVAPQRRGFQWVKWVEEVRVV